MVSMTCLFLEGGQFLRLGQKEGRLGVFFFLVSFIFIKVIKNNFGRNELLKQWGRIFLFYSIE